MVMWILLLAAAAYAVIEWPAVSLLLRGFGCFCVMLGLLLLLLGGFALFWLLDEGLKRLQDFVCEQVETLE